MNKENIFELGPNGWIEARKTMRRIAELFGDLPIRWLDPPEMDHAVMDCGGVTVASMTREVTRWQHGEPNAGSYIVFLHF